MSHLLTQSELKRHLSYDPETGVFRRRISTAHRVKVGEIAGSIGTKGYRVIMIATVNYKAHRLAFLYMTGAFPQEEVDHINGNRSDNSWGNLRAVSRAENSLNRKMSVVNKSGATGVYWDDRTKKWVAQVKRSGRRRYLEHFDSFDEAVKRRALVASLYGLHPNHGKAMVDGVRK